MSEDTKCPHCGGAIVYQYAAKAAEQSRLRFVLHPMPGEYLQAKVVGQSLSALDDLLVASGKQLGANSVVLVEKIENDIDAGSVNFHLLVARGPAFDERKKRMRKARKP